MTLCVVGSGAMGRWVAETVERDVAFADVNEAAASDAAAELGGETVSLDADGTPAAGEAETFEAVCLAVPMPVVADAVADWAPHTETAMVDVSGVMAAPVEAMREHLPDHERASLHPLFAPKRAPGTVACVADVVGPVLSPLLDDLRDAGNDLFETTPAEHDEAMETVQGATHAAVLAWALAADEVRDEFHTPISAGLADIAETVTEGEARVYADVQQTFGGAESVAQAARRLADASDDSATFADCYVEAGARLRGQSDDSSDGQTDDSAAESPEVDR